jgi:uncharacterized protein (TIGR03067 family)
MKATIGLCLFTVLTLGVGGDADVKKELDKFAGKWEVGAITYDGKDQDVKFKIVFKGNDGKVEGNDEVTNEYAKIKFKVNPATKLKEMDITIAAGSQTDATMKGIYEFKDDELRICAKVFGNERPKEFAAPDGSSIVLLTLKRAAK